MTANECRPAERHTPSLISRSAESWLSVALVKLVRMATGRSKQVYKITYPNGKIYVGMDLTGSVAYFGSPIATGRIAADLAAHRLDLTARKQILWESDTATDAEVRAMEAKLIRECGANDPAVGYNLTSKFVPPEQITEPPTMRWYARPEGDSHQLRVAPRLDCWEKAGHPDQVRLQAYLDDTEELLVDSRIVGPWALRLDVGLPAKLELLHMRDLDNYARPLADRLKDREMVSVWCTKKHREQSFVRIEAARELATPANVVVVSTPSATDYKEQINAAVADATELPDGPVRLELSFVIGPTRNWVTLWKPTIDALEPLLGRDPSDERPWNPRDGRITELGMHKTVDPDFGNKIAVGMSAVPA
jgi:hypothetical protein